MPASSDALFVEGYDFFEHATARGMDRLAGRCSGHHELKNNPKRSFGVANSVASAMNVLSVD